MQSTNIRQIKAALRDQAFLGTTRVSCPMGPVVAESLEEGATPGDDPWVGALVPRGEHTWPEDSIRILAVLTGGPLRLSGQCDIG